MIERRSLALRTTWLAEPGVWIWEITEAGGEQVIESCWAAGWVGYGSEEEAEHAGLGRLAEMQAAAGAWPAGDDGSGSPPDGAATTALRTPRGRLIVVPRSRASLYRALKRSFEDDDNVEVVLDRRFRERRSGRPHDQTDRRFGDRRRRSDVEGQLAAGRSVTIPVTPARPAPFDADGRAILVLCCAWHVVGCQACEQTYQVRWLAPRGLAGFSCPGCGADMALELVRHTYSCRYWIGRTTGRSPRSTSETPVSA